MPSRYATRWMILFVALLPISGCYTYRDVPLATLYPGVQARLRLDPEGFGRVVNQAAMSGVPVESMDMVSRGVIGRVVDTDGEVLTVQLRGVGGEVFNAEVAVRSIQELALRRFSGTRTALAVGGVVALSAATLTGVVGGTTSGPEPPGPEQFGPLFFSIPIAIGIPVR